MRRHRRVHQRDEIVGVRGSAHTETGRTRIDAPHVEVAQIEQRRGREAIFESRGVVRRHGPCSQSVGEPVERLGFIICRIQPVGCGTAKQQQGIGGVCRRPTGRVDP